LGIVRAIASEVFAVTDCNPSPCLSSTTITFQFLADCNLFFSTDAALPSHWPRRGCKVLCPAFHQSPAILFQVTPHTFVDFWDLGHPIGHQKGSAVIRFVAGAIGTWCNVSPVVATSRVIVGADFVPSSGEGIVGVEVVKAHGCSNPKAVQLSLFCHSPD